MQPLFKHAAEPLRGSNLLRFGEEAKGTLAAAHKVIKRMNLPVGGLTIRSSRARFAVSALAL